MYLALGSTHTLSYASGPVHYPHQRRRPLRPSRPLVKLPADVTVQGPPRCYGATADRLCLFRQTAVRDSTENIPRVVGFA